MGHPKMALEETPPTGIALFDMDGTLIPWDCQLPFRHHVLRSEPWRFYSVPVFLLFLPFAPVLGTANMKRIFHCFLWKMSPERVDELSREFAARLQTNVYAELISDLERHKANDHLTILSSASPQCYAAEVGRLLGFDISLGTVLENNAFFPDLTNHKGGNKVSRLREILPSSYFKDGVLMNSHGYTDSTADLPMLTICDKATVVNPREELESLAKESSWMILRPTLPWKSRTEKAWRILLLLLGLGKNPAKL
ncbi:MAG: HAD family hydrolase [Akkermansiaceae bacterium]